jgi:hypothetical protein
VPIDNRWTEKFFVTPAVEEYEAERREQALVFELEAYLRGRGHDAARLKTVPRGEKRPLFCDIYDKTAGVLNEAKGTVAREAVRMAIGQLFDYSASRPPTRPSRYCSQRSHELTSSRSLRHPTPAPSGRRTTSSRRPVTPSSRRPARLDQRDGFRRGRPEASLPALMFLST